jgi:hypothetical protein
MSGVLSKLLDEQFLPLVAGVRPLLSMSFFLFFVRAIESRAGHQPTQKRPCAASQR